MTSPTFEIVPGESLRQGDVCSVAEFPRWTVKSAPVHLQSGQQKIGVLVESMTQPLTLPSGRRLVVVCSYDCDLENPRARAGILLAPLIRLPAPLGSEKAQSIMASNIPVDNEINHVSMFFVPIEIDSDDVPAIVDFSSMMTLCPVKEAISELQANKYKEMAEAVRIAFQDKLALFTTRRGFGDDQPSG